MIFGIMIWINMILDRAGTAMSVIGWIQFGLLTLTIGLPLLLVAIFMIVPIKYDFKGAFCESKEFSDEEDKSEDESEGAGEMMKKMVTDFLLKVTDPIRGDGKFSWLAGLIKGEMFYQHRELSWKVRILFKKISSEDVSNQDEETTSTAEDKEPEKKESVSSKNEVEKKANVSLESTAEKQVSVSSENKAGQKISTSLENKAGQKTNASLENKAEKRATVSLENRFKKKVSIPLEGKEEKKTKIAQETMVQVAEPEKAEDTQRRENESKEEDNSFFEKAGDFFEKIEEGVENINEKMEYTYEQICDKIDLVSEGKEKITDFISDETHQGAYKKFVGELKRLLAAVKPTKIKGNLKVGFENPKTTGLFIAGASLIYPYTGGNANLEADFDNKVLEGDLRIKGKLRIGSLAWFATRMAVNKDVQATAKDIVKLVPKKGGS